MIHDLFGHIDLDVMGFQLIAYAHFTYPVIKPTLFEESVNVSRFK
jgi:hypothetical protein